MYCTLTDLKTYLGITGTAGTGTGTTGDETGDDALLTDLLASAQTLIDRHCGRTFEAAADATRYYTVGVDTIGRTLFLDRDLCQITSVITNADADDGGTTLADADYTTRPRNETPYHAIVLRLSSDAVWEYTVDPEDGIAVTGRWAWSVTAPDDIVQACRRAAAWLYRQKDAQVFDVTAQVATGAVTIRQELPRDVRDLLEPYVRRI